MDDEFTFYQTVTLHLKRPSLWNAILIQLLTGFFIGAAFSFFMIYNKDGFIHPKFILFLLCFLIVIILISIIACILMRPKHDLAIEFHPDHILLPSKIRFSRPVKIIYQDINSVVERGRKKQKIIIIGTKKRVFVYKLSQFLEPVTSDYFLDILARYLTAQPDGEKLWQGIKERIDLFNQSMKPKVYATWGIFAVIAVVFIIEIFLGVLNNEMILLELGANASVLVKDGEWYRLFNSNFLHLNFNHIYFNVVFLLFVGVGVERLAGIWNFLFIYLLSALGGAVASLLMNSALFSVGASTALYGLLGALAFINIKYRGKLPVGYRIPRNNWILLILLTILFIFIFPQIDNAAHAGGFITGIVLTSLIYRNRTNAVISSKPGTLVKGLTVVIAAFFLYGGLVSITQCKKGSNPGLVRLAELFDDVPDTSPAVLNNLAWNIVINKQENEEVLHFALGLAEKAASLEEDKLEFQDTFATALFMTGNDERAIEMERKTLARTEMKKKQRIYATQIACFAANNHSSKHPVIIGEVKNPNVRFYSEWTDKGTKRHLVIKADIDRALKNVVVYLKQTRNGDDNFIIRFTVINPQQMTYTFETKAEDEDSDYGHDILLIDTSENVPELSGNTWTLWLIDKQILKIYSN